MADDDNKKCPSIPGVSIPELPDLSVLGSPLLLGLGIDISPAIATSRLVALKAAPDIVMSGEATQALTAGFFLSIKVLQNIQDTLLKSVSKRLAAEFDDVMGQLTDLRQLAHAVKTGVIDLPEHLSDLANLSGEALENALDDHLGELGSLFGGFKSAVECLGGAAGSSLGQFSKDSEELGKGKSQGRGVSDADDRNAAQDDTEEVIPSTIDEITETITTTLKDIFDPGAEEREGRNREREEREERENRLDEQRFRDARIKAREARNLLKKSKENVPADTTTAEKRPVSSNQIDIEPWDPKDNLGIEPDDEDNLSWLAARLGDAVLAADLGVNKVSEHSQHGGVTPGIHTGIGHAEDRAIDIGTGASAPQLTGQASVIAWLQNWSKTNNVTLKILHAENSKGHDHHVHAQVESVA
jgi:hypothetical protein